MNQETLRQNETSTSDLFVLNIIFGCSGHILNDGDLGVDYLGHSVYAEALVRIIADEDLKTPLTIGLFARWGSGKTFLLHHVCSKSGRL